MRQDIFKQRSCLLREKRMNICHRAEQFRRQQEAQADAVSQETGGRVIWKQLHMIKHVQLRMLPELHRRLQKLLLRSVEG